MDRYNFKLIEDKWQKFWEENDIDKWKFKGLSFLNDDQKSISKRNNFTRKYFKPNQSSR